METQERGGIDFTEVELVHILSARFFTPTSCHVRGTLKMLPYVLGFVRGDRIEAFFSDESTCFLSLCRQVQRNDAIEYVRNAFLLFTMMETAQRANLRCFYDKEYERPFDMNLVL